MADTHEPSYSTQEVQVNTTLNDKEIQRVKIDINFALNEVEIMKNTQKNFVWELNKIQENINTKASIQSILKINNKLHGE